MTIIGQDHSIINPFLILMAVGVLLLLCSLLFHLLERKHRSETQTFIVPNGWYAVKMLCLFFGMSFVFCFGAGLIALSDTQIVKVSDKAYIDEVVHGSYGNKITDIQDNYIIAKISKSDIKDIEKQVKLNRLLNKTKK